MCNFQIYRVVVQRQEQGAVDQVTIKGEISNRSGRTFNAISIRAILRNDALIVGNTLIVVYGLAGGATKTFTHSPKDLDFGRLINPGTKCYCQVESAF